MNFRPAVRLMSAAVLLATCLPLPAHAGQACGETSAVRPDHAAKAAELAARVRDTLEAGQHSFALITRIGLDLSEFGLRHTHVGVAWRDHPRGRWYTFHLLNRCGTGQSELIEQPLEDFYKVELFDYEALVELPSFPFQVRLQRAFFSPLAQQMHEREYNMIAHPFSSRYQNSNQWVLEVAASALAPAGAVAGRESAQEWLRSAGYVPGEIPISTSRRIGARLFSPHVRFSDHSLEEAQSQRYQVVTVDSVLRFLRARDPQMSETVVRLTPSAAPAATVK